MNTQNGTSSSETSGAAEQQFEALKANLKKLVHRFDATPESFFGKVKQQIKVHPIAATGIAFGVGYLLVRLARRR